jgi:hypothetical protein
MKVNPKKCACSGALHGDAAKGLVAAAAGLKTNPMIKRRLEGVRLQGHGVPFYRADQDAYTYMGVPLTLSLHYKPYMTRLLSDVRERLDKLDASFAGPRQRLRILHTATGGGRERPQPL